MSTCKWCRHELNKELYCENCKTSQDSKTHPILCGVHVIPFKTDWNNIIIHVLGSFFIIVLIILLIMFKINFSG